MTKSSKGSSAPVVDKVRITKVHDAVGKVAVASFGAVQVPTDTEFQVFSRRMDKKTQQLLVHGESAGIEYEGQTQPDQSQYMVALYDADTGNVELYPGAAYVEMGTVVSKLKKSSQPEIKSKDIARVAQRNTLGETFGTRKAKKAITDQVVNRIDTGMLEDIEGELVDAVATTTANLPTQDQMEATMLQNRPIPPHNPAAEKREDIYPLHGIVPKREWAAIRVDAVLREKDADARKALMPSGTTEFVAARLVTCTDAAKHTEKLQLLYYVGLLMAVYSGRKSVRNKTGLVKLLNNPPDLLVTGILDRFVGVQGGSEFGRSKERAFYMDSAHETKLLCYLLALMLRLDNYVLEVLPLAAQLGLKPSRLSEVMRQLGCLVKNASAVQAEALGLTKQAAATYKIATLSAPLKLPEMVRRKRRAA